MSRPWVQVSTGIFNDRNFKRLSRDARHTFHALMPLAGGCDNDNSGVLAERSGPVTVDEISEVTKIDVVRMHEVMQELIDMGFVTLTGNTFALANWEDHQPPLSGKERQRNYRERKKSSDGALRDERNANVTQTHPERSGAPKQLSLKPAPAESDLKAWALLDAAYAVVKEHTNIPTTARDWKSRNKRAAVGILESGRTVDDVVAMLKKAYTDPHLSKFYGGMSRLDKLAESWKFIERGKPGPRPRQYVDISPAVTA